MATYNFSVRATDNLGAYADRSFSITVNNTNIDRFAIVGASGLAHSTDAVTWNYESGISGSGVTYGNGKWVVYGLGNLAIRTSVDAFNWTTINTTIETSHTFSGAGNPVLNNTDIFLLKFRNGLWSAFTRTSTAQVTASNYTSYVAEYTSPDLATWTFARQIGPFVDNTGNNSCYPLDYEFDPVLQNHVLTVSSINTTFLYSRTNAGAYTSMISANNAAKYLTGTLSYTNGLWCACLGGTSASGINVYTSTDAIGWTSRIVDSTVTSGYFAGGLSYANGRLWTRLFATSNNASVAYYSLNGGRTWIKTATTISDAVAGLAQQSGARSSVAYFGGKLLFAGGNGTATGFSSSNDGVAATQFTLTGTGAINGMAVRTT